MRARICDDGEYAARPSIVPSAATTDTVSPDAGSPSTASIAPEKSHGWRWRNDFSRPGLSFSTGPFSDAASAKGHARDASDQIGDAARERAQQQHARTRVQRIAAGEQ